MRGRTQRRSCVFNKIVGSYRPFLFLKKRTFGFRSASGLPDDQALVSGQEKHPRPYSTWKWPYFLASV
jgi:hypothetical protein